MNERTNEPTNSKQVTTPASNLHTHTHTHTHMQTNKQYMVKYRRAMDKHMSHPRIRRRTCRDSLYLPRCASSCMFQFRTSVRRLRRSRMLFKSLGTQCRDSEAFSQAQTRTYIWVEPHRVFVVSQSCSQNIHTWREYRTKMIFWGLISG